MDNFSLTKKVCRRKIYSCKFNSVAKFYCQISVTKVNKLSNIFTVCEHKSIAKDSVTNNLCHRKIVRGKQALTM